MGSTVAVRLAAPQRGPLAPVRGRSVTLKTTTRGCVLGSTDRLETCTLRSSSAYAASGATPESASAQLVKFSGKAATPAASCAAVGCDASSEPV